MTKSIFDYDSSDGEMLGYDSVSPRKIRNDNNNNFLYDAGNAVLHHKSVFKKYRDKKAYKTKPESKLVNKFLTNKVYTDDDKTDESLSPFLVKQSKQEKKSLETLFQDSRELYSKIEKVAGKFQEKEAIINIINYIDTLDELQSSDVAKTFGIQKAKIEEFKNLLNKIKGLKENIQELKSFTNKFPVMKQVLQKAISQEEEPDYGSLTATQNLCEKFKSAVDYLIEVKKLYTYLEKLAGTKTYCSKGGTVNTVNLKCFDVLQKATSQKKLDNITKTSVANTWGIKESKVEDFLNECEEECNNFLELIKCRNVFRDMNNIIQGKIQKFITKLDHDMDFNFVLYLACDKEVSGITHYLSQEDKQISDKIKVLDFFSTGKGSQLDASEFLSNSLLYQKYLKTLAKFVSLRNLQGTDKHTVASKITISTTKNHELDISSDFSSTSKRTEKVLTLGDYKNVSKKLTSSLNGLNEPAEKVVDLFKRILKGEALYSKNLQSKNNTDHVKDLHDIVYLLFSCEPNRNPSALITNAMFLELVKEGQYEFDDMAEKMPMAIDGAIEIGRYFHYQSKTEKRVNDYGITKTKPKNTDEFVQRGKDLLEDWIKYCVIGKDIGKEIQDLILRWYGIGIKLKAAGEKKEDFKEDSEENISPHKNDQGFQKQEKLVQNLIQTCIEYDKYHLSDFANSCYLSERKGILETLKYWYIEPIVKILINSKEELSEYSALNILRLVLQDIECTQYGNTIFYGSGTSKDFLKINKIFYETTLTFKEIKRIFLTVDYIIKEYLSHIEHQETEIFWLSQESTQMTYNDFSYNQANYTNVIKYINDTTSHNFDYYNQQHVEVTGEIYSFH